MLTNSLVIIPFNLPSFWIADFLNQTSNCLSNNKNQVVIFLWSEAKSIREIIFEALLDKKLFSYFNIKEKVLIITPIHLLPFRRFEIIELVNLMINVFVLKIISLLLYRNYKKKTLWIFHPNFFNFPSIFGSAYLSLYDCVDYVSSVDIDTNKKIREKEIRLIKATDKMVVNSHVLNNIFKKLKKDIKIVPQGFDVKTYRSYKKIKSKDVSFPADKKIIGFVGAINYRLDYDLLLDLVTQQKDCYFVFIGPKQVSDEEKSLQILDRLEKLLKNTNVIWIDVQPKEKIPGLIEYFDIAMIPYNAELEFNKFCYPMKLFEYFYMGKSVISTPIEELKRFPKYVKIGKTAKEWEKHIKYLLSKPWPVKYQKEQRKLAIENSWENKIETISKVIEKKYTNSS